MSDEQQTINNGRPLMNGPRLPSVPIRWSLVGSLGSLVLTLSGALLFTSLVLLASGTSLQSAYELILFGALRNPRSLADMVMLAAPLLLCAAGLTLTFTAGLYNLGVEGQMTLGAICAMIPLRLLVDLPPPLLWLLAFVAGASGGALWALLVALLRVYASVNEIFAGLGLNFVARGVALYLILGPWQQPGVASTSGTEPLPYALRLPTLEGLRLAPLAPVLAVAALVFVWLLLKRTRWGLTVRATGLNAVSAGRLGVPTTRRLIESLCGCGALAGIAGTVQVIAVHHALTPDISSGIGLLAILVVLLVRYNPLWVLPVALLFAVFTQGSIRLPLELGIDSSISGVLQGALVLFALLARGLQARFAGRRQ